ncbi:C40 family peptidase [Adhaeretor mobilis]|uniref:Dipeptidyl-peptidase 6 n=1 Tax=Adhaeretor mobilis TaxID=1930276 RepID=A0A517MVE3_9BACT|nr:C40 family peptidase [Adhaeretor mobilis]QDS98757.1 Dipeptidyl-peptidase 6 [Adhaeretor mobilis]
MLLAIVFLLLFLPTGRVEAKPKVVAPPAEDDRLTNLAKQIEPDLEGRTERLSQYVEFFRSQLGNDTRLFAFSVTPHVTDAGEVSLSGYVEFSQTRTGLVGFLEALGFKVIDEELDSLPAEDLGAKAFGFVKTTHTLSYSRPSEPRSVVTDCLLGEPLYLLREEGDHLLVHSGEGYLGYVASADVYRVNAKAFDLFPTESAVRVIANHTLDSGLVVPAGALLKQLPDESGKVVCALPTGEVVELPSDSCEPTTPPTEDIEQAIEVGKRLLGTPYHWGGKTSSGVDCSGLVQVAFSTCGVHLPRDSNQQFLLGQLTATRWHTSGLRRGDTLYFLGSNGRIRHTALYLGDSRFLQAEMPAVNVRSFNPEHEEYDERRVKAFAFGKRLWQ